VGRGGRAREEAGSPAGLRRQGIDLFELKAEQVLPLHPVSQREVGGLPGDPTRAERRHRSTDLCPSACQRSERVEIRQGRGRVHQPVVLVLR